MATNYPGSLDSYTRPTSTDQMDAAGVQGDVVVDNLYDAVEAIETELGTNPSGSFTTVKDRLDDMPFARSASHTGWHGPNGTFGTGIPAEGDLRVYPLALRAGTITKIGTEASVGGSTGATVRLGIWTDAGGQPGSLVLDSGAVSAESSGGIEITVSSTPIAGGYYWVSGVVQGGATTRPTMRVLVAHYSAPNAVQAWAGQVATLPGRYSVIATGITGSLPATFTRSSSTTATEAILVAVRYS